MALSTLLEIVTRACDELALPRPSSVAGSADSQVLQLLALINRGGKAMMREHAWRGLATLHTFSTAIGVEDYAYPADFDRLIAATEWDRSNDRRLGGPLSPAEDRFQRESAAAVSALHRRFRLVGGAMRVFPTPTAVETLLYEYVSNAWARSSGGTAQAEFQADADTSVFEADLHVLDVSWRFMARKGMDAAALHAEFMQELAVRISADKGQRTISLAPGRALRQAQEEVFLGAHAIPDAGFGGL